MRDDDLSVLGSRRRREQLVSHHQPSVPLRSSQPQPRPALCSDCPSWPVNTLSDHELYRHLMCVVCYIIDFQNIVHNSDQRAAGCGGRSLELIEKLIFYLYTAFCFYVTYSDRRNVT